MNLGSGPIGTINLGFPVNATVAASMAGTAAATQIMSSASFSYARSIEVFNMTGANFELLIGGADAGTSDYTNTTIGTAVSFGANGQIFIPGSTAAASAVGRGMRFPCQFQQGMAMWLRTTANANVTIASTGPFVINFWA